MLLEILLHLWLFSHLKDCLAPKHWGIGRAPNAWMTCESFFEYICNVFHSYLKTLNIKLPVILVLEGYRSHMSLPLSEFCSNNGIILIALPPNYTHILQPLDIAFFKPLKSKWSSELNEFKMKNQGREPRKHDVTTILEEILRREDFKTTISNGFKRSGISPFNPNAVDYSKCITSQKKNEHENQLDESTCSTFLNEFESRIPASLKLEFEKTITTS